MNPRFPPIAITGWGLATPLGNSAPQTWHALLAGRSILDHAPAMLPCVAGADRICQLSAHASREALSMSGWTQAENPTLVISTSKGPVETWLSGESPTSLEGFGLAQSSLRLADELSLCPGLVISAACASGLCALIRGVMLLQLGEARRVLVVGVESSLHPLFIGCFNRLGVLPRPGEPCRPFDVNRSGFLMSEAAAAVCLEIASGDSKLVVEGFACGGAGGHLTSGDPDGGTLRHLLGRALARRPVGLVHGHGTGTDTHDAMELAALEANLSPERSAILYSHKGALGHSLGAAGLISVVLNCMAHREGRIPGNINTPHPLATEHLTIPRGVTTISVKRSVAIASGFGGPTAVVTLESF